MKGTCHHLWWSIPYIRRTGPPHIAAFHLSGEAFVGDLREIHGGRNSTARSVCRRVYIYIYILYIHKFLIRQVFPLPPYLMHHLYIQCTYISIYVYIYTHTSCWCRFCAWFGIISVLVSHTCTWQWQHSDIPSGILSDMHSDSPSGSFWPIFWF